VPSTPAIAGTKHPAEKVAGYALASMGRSRRHIIPMWDARTPFPFKRFFPESAFQPVSLVCRKGIVEEESGLYDV